MAHHEEEAPRGHRLFSVGAVALLAGATALGFGRVFNGQVPTLKLLAAALASVLVAAALERRNLLLAAVASMAGLYIAIGWLVFPGSLWHGIPAGRTIEAIGRALGKVGEQARTEIAPTEALRPLLLAAVTAVWTASFSAHALAVRSGSPLLAAAPPGALLAFSDVVMVDGARPLYAGLFLVGALATVYADGLRRVRQWGPLRPWSSTRRSRLLSSTTTRGARRVTLAALGIALLVPGILPGFQSQAVLRINERGNGAGPEIDPLVSVTSNLQREQAIELFRVETDPPGQSAYWRWLSLDRFDGVSWSNDDLYVHDGRTVDSALSLPGVDAEDTAAKTVVTLNQTFQVVEPPGTWLPMAFEPDVVKADASLQYDPATVAMVAGDENAPGFDYKVTSKLVEPTAEQLDEVNDADFSPVPRRYTGLPTDTPQRIYDIAHEVTAGAATPFRKLLAIQDYLQGFKYDQNVSDRHDFTALVDFLDNTKRGFCQQFATAMAVLARALGYPARVAVGFTAGTYDPRVNAWRVYTSNAHAWVEVLFPGYGWMAFEPTPTRLNPVADLYLQEPLPTLTQDCPQYIQRGEPCRLPATKTDVPGGAQADSRQQDENRSGNELPSQKVVQEIGSPAGPGIPNWIRVLLLLAVLILLAAAIVFVPLTKVLWRRLALRRARTPRDRAIAALALFSAQASDLGLGRTPGETLEEYRIRLRSRVAFSDGHLDRLTEVAGRAAYSLAGVDPEEARDAVRAGSTAIRDVRREASLGRRIMGLWTIGRRASGNGENGRAVRR